MLIPATPQEVKDRGWSQLDVILINGDATIDSPFNGVSLIARQLEADGFKVGIIAQPDYESERDITRLGEPTLFWGVSAGAVDSMVANYTALGRPRRLDDHTPGGQNTRRPDRASIVYSNLIRKYFKNTRPIVLGGIEASLRRVVHYDFWSDSLRRSILLDAKADFLLYGMADLTVLEFARALRDGTDPKKIRGLCYPSVVKPADYLEMPSYEECQAEKASFTRMFDIFYKNNDPITAQGLAQRYLNRYVIQNPPAPALTTEELDKVYALPFTHEVHPFDAAKGEVRAMETIKNSIVSHRGCYGECSFCAIAVHEGRRVSWRSQESILAEARAMTQRPGFKGIISDLSGPTANMYGFECAVKTSRGACRDQSCIYPQVCPVLPVTHDPQVKLLKALRELPGVRKVFVSSGIRPDLVAVDANFGDDYMDELVNHHVSGQLKLAPEHSEPSVLRRMRKPSIESTLKFKEAFDEKSIEAGKEQFLTYYMIAAYPGCGEAEMISLQEFCADNLGVLPEQVQIFTPTPSTYGSLMYYTERDPWTGEQIFVEKGLTGKMQQKALITGWRKKRDQADAPTTEREARGFSDRPRTERFGSRTDRPRVNRPRRAWQPDKPAYETDRSDHHKGYQPPRPEAAPEVRVVKDEYGRFAQNRLPEGWVVKEPQAPRRSDSDDRRAQASREKRPAFGEERFDKPSSWDRRSSERSGYGRKPEGESSPETRSARPYRPSGDRPAGERPYRPSGDRPYERKTEGNTGTEPRRPYRSSGDRPAADRPYRPSGDRPYERKTEGDTGTETRRPYRPSGDRPAGDRPYRPSGDRPYERKTEGTTGTETRRPYRPSGDRPAGDRPYRPSGDRPVGDRPYRSSGDRPVGDRPYRSSSDRPAGDRPNRPAGDRPYTQRSDSASGTETKRPYRPSGDRPAGDRPNRPAGDRPYTPRSDSASGTETKRPYRPSGDRPAGDRPYRPSGDRKPYVKREGTSSSSSSYHREGSSSSSRPEGHRPYSSDKRPSDRGTDQAGQKSGTDKQKTPFRRSKPKED